jgi:hypothetical protein
MQHGIRDLILLPVLQPQQRLHAPMQQTLRGSWITVPISLGGGLAQLGEHYVRNVGVGGSTPLPSTKHPPAYSLTAIIRGETGPFSYLARNDR